MNFTHAINSWGPIVLVAIALVWAWERKHELPDHYEPVTVEESNRLIKPLLDDAKLSAKNWSLRNIPYALDQLCDPTTSPSRRVEYRQQLSIEYGKYEWATGQPHWYRNMSLIEICNERKE